MFFQPDLFLVYIKFLKVEDQFLFKSVFIKILCSIVLFKDRNKFFPYFFNSTRFKCFDC